MHPIFMNLIAHIKQPGNEYMHIIADASEWDIQKDITQHWSGIVVFPDKEATWKNEENDTAIRNHQKQQLLFTAWCGIGILLFTASVYFQPSLLYNLFGFLSLAGVFISIAAFGTELGIQSNVVKQVCGAVGKGGCEKVLQSKMANGIFGVTPADAAVLYFTAQFIVYLVTAFYPIVFPILPVMAIAGIAVVGISIYTQAAVLKQWCALCLGIAAILLLQGAASLFILTAFSVYSLTVFFIAVLLLTAILLPVKALIKYNIATRPKLAELKKWQSDVTIFLALLAKENEVDIAVWENDLVIGNVHAPVMITVACNPYCGPCAKAHAALDDLMERFVGKVKVQIRLLCLPASETDKRTIAVKAILRQAAILKTNTELQAMLTDWFMLMDLEKWSSKWNASENIEITNALQKHDTWINEAGITHTPTFFVNGKKLAGRYGLKELEKLIPQLAEEILEAV